MITFNQNYFTGEVPSSWKVFMANLIWLLIRMAGTDRRRNHSVMFVLCLCLLWLCLYYLQKFSKLYVSHGLLNTWRITSKKLSQFLLLTTINISSKGLYSALNSIAPLQVPFQNLKSSLRVLFGSLLFEEKEN